MDGVELKRSKRAKYMRLTVHPGGAVVLVAPHWQSMRTIERFIQARAGWIARAVEKMRGLTAIPTGKREYLARREEARALVEERLVKWNALYQCDYGRVAIKNTRSLWGSCSRRGNLNFTFALVHLPSQLVDYVVVHELCHLKEANHSKHFWALVAKALPEYKQLRESLRTYLLRA